MTYYDDGVILIRDLGQEDVQKIVDAELALGGEYEKDKYEMRLEDQSLGKAVALVAVYGDEIAGYINVYIESPWGAPARGRYPELVDLCVFKPYRGMRLGTKLMDVAEKIASKYNSVVYLGVGILSDYGLAQRMYAKRGYIPDGSGTWFNDEMCKSGYKYPVEELALYMCKSLT